MIQGSTFFFFLNFRSVCNLLKPMSFTHNILACSNLLSLTGRTPSPWLQIISRNCPPPGSVPRGLGRKPAPLFSVCTSTWTEQETHLLWPRSASGLSPHNKEGVFSLNNTFLKKEIYLFSVCTHTFVFICTMCVEEVTVEARRGSYTLWGLELQVVGSHQTWRLGTCKSSKCP